MPREFGVLSLFTGAGGLDLGLEAAGFHTRLCVENDPDAIATLAANRPHWKIAKICDAIEFAMDPRAALEDAKLNRRDIAVLSGGPPCQPFSKASYWTSDGPSRMRDPRSQTISAYLQIVDSITPEVLLFENVSAFTYKGRNEGFNALRKGIDKINRRRRTAYVPHVIHINAANFGIPQIRQRVFVIAHRRGRQFVLPSPTHGVAEPCQPFLTSWDAIGHCNDTPGVGDLALQGRWADLLHSIPEGHNYLWHTPEGEGKALFGWRTRFWSFLLKLSKRLPAWTISASPGPATGPFHWRGRLLSVEELCRLQTFPDGYCVAGNRRVAQRQIGNAVPAALAELLGREIRRQLLSDTVSRRALTLLPKRRHDCPPAEPIWPVARRYLHLIGEHAPHPGTGNGPLRQAPRLSKISGK